MKGSVELLLIAMRAIDFEAIFYQLCPVLKRPVHALRGIMGNQGKIAKKQSGKKYVYLHISILRFIFERKLIL